MKSLKEMRFIEMTGGELWNCEHGLTFKICKRGGESEEEDEERSDGDDKDWKTITRLNPTGFPQV